MKLMGWSENLLDKSYQPKGLVLAETVLNGLPPPQGDCRRLSLLHSLLQKVPPFICGFGDKGNIFKVLAEAPYARILYRHRLELTKSNCKGVDKNEDSQMDTGKQRFHNSLPMHTIPPFLGHFSLNIISKLDKMRGQCCLFGTGDHVSKKESAQNNKYFHSLNEAMGIDTYFAGNEEILQRCRNFTYALVLSLFNVARHRPRKIWTNREQTWI